VIDLNEIRNPILGFVAIVIHSPAGSSSDGAVSSFLARRVRALARIVRLCWLNYPNRKWVLGHGVLNPKRRTCSRPVAQTLAVGQRRPPGSGEDGRVHNEGTSVYHRGATSLRQSWSSFGVARCAHHTGEQ